MGKLSLGGLLGQLAKFDPALVVQIVTILVRMREQKALADKVKLAANALVIAADFTETDVDDKVADTLKQLIDNDQLTYLINLVESFMSSRGEDDLTEEELMSFASGPAAATGFNPMVLITIAKAILMVIRLWG